MNYISDVQGLRLAEGLEINKSLEVLILHNNTLTKKSGFALKDSILKHQSLTKVDLNCNLVPLKLVSDIDKHCAVNNDKGDLKFLPGLKREFRKQK